MNSTFTRILRLILGLGLIIFGLTKFISFGFLPEPYFPEEASRFLESLSNTGYVLKAVGVFELAIGILLIFNKWIPFALLLLAPITLNIFLFHVFLDTPGLIRALIVIFLNAILIYKYWKSYRPLFI